MSVEEELGKKNGCPKSPFPHPERKQKLCLKCWKIWFDRVSREPVEVLHEISSEFLLFEQSLFFNLKGLDQGEGKQEILTLCPFHS